MNKASLSCRLLADGRIDLPEVTLVAASSKALSATIRALQKCLAQVRPADAILFSDTSPLGEELVGLRHVETCRMKSRQAYSNFILKDLVSHLETDFVLCIQWDGYILNAQNWSDDFLTVDYIGAPWPQFDDGHDVGNGGFSLRSRRLLQVCADKRISENAAEDIAICRIARPLLELEYGIRFADRYLARKFAYERTAAQGDEFGFHGVFNMAGITPRQEYREVIASLETGLLRRSDMVELLRGAVRRLDFGLARLMLRSMLQAGSAKLDAECRSTRVA